MGTLYFFCYLRLYYIQIAKTKKTEDIGINRKNKDTNAPLSVDLPDGSTYYAYLRQFAAITNKIADEFPYMEFPVHVQVSKKIDSYCEVGIYFIDLPNLKKYNISFGKEFQTDDDSAHFYTDKATGYSTPEQVKSDILSAFDFNSLPKRISDSTFIAHGQMATTPLVSFDFIIGSKEKL